MNKASALILAGTVLALTGCSKHNPVAPQLAPICNTCPPGVICPEECRP